MMYNQIENKKMKRRNVFMNIPKNEYPRPQLVREAWMNLNGSWEFEIDNSKSGEDRELYLSDKLSDKITVPFCPESELSGVENKDFMACVWYKKTFTLPKEWKNKRIIIHFEAVDYHAKVWINKNKAGEHRGGYTGFELDITKFISDGENTVVLCAYDDVRTGLQNGGKQSALHYSHDCDYTRTTGIWQTVWLEAVEDTYVKAIKFTPNVPDKSILLHFDMSENSFGSVVCASAYFDGKKTGEAKGTVSGYGCDIIMKLDELHLWDIGEGNLYDLEVTVSNGGKTADSFKSYFGMRSVDLKDGKFLLNGRSVFGRWVLDQGFYPDGIYTAPNDEALVNDIKLSMSYGFNGARLHEKVFEQRFLYHADRLGYLCWGEMGNWKLNIDGDDGLLHFLPEWTESVKRDYSHPSIIGWCPFNETNKEQNDEILRQVYRITKMLDSSRPVIDTSGWFHVETDIFDVHDYESDKDKLFEKYGENRIFNNTWHAPGRQVYRGEPYFISEYGGIKWYKNEDGSGSDKNDSKKNWGYGGIPRNEEEFFERLEYTTDAFMQNKNVFAICYTQLYDVEQEQNGLATYSRVPKFDPEKVKKILSKKAAIED